MQAVVKIKGHQYLVSEKMKLKINKTVGESGETLKFENVLLAFDGKEFKLGKPEVAKASVEAKILRQTKERKVMSFRYKPKARVRTKRGFRPQYTEIEIQKINA